MLNFVGALPKSVHDKVADCPGVMTVAGFAVKLEIVGG